LVDDNDRDNTYFLIALAFFANGILKKKVFWAYKI